MSFRRRGSMPYEDPAHNGYAPPYMARGQGDQHSVDMPGFYKSKSVSQAFGDDFRPDPNAHAGSHQDMQNFVGAHISVAVCRCMRCTRSCVDCLLLRSCSQVMVHVTCAHTSTTQPYAASACRSSRSGWY